MLGRLTLILLAIPALALAADGDVVKSSAMRLAVVQKAAPTVTPPKITSLAPLVTPADPAECRASCAQTYYFCRAGDQPDQCPDSWGECVATCDSPNLARNFSTAR